MQKFVRVCPICAKENIRKESHSEIYVPGYMIGLMMNQVMANFVWYMKINNS